MSENPSTSVETQNELSDLLDDALKDFEDSGESTAQSTMPDVNTFSADNDFLKESFEDTMKSFMNSDQAELAANLQQIILGEVDSDLQAVIQESLKNLSEAKLNLPEGNDINNMASMFANMGMQDDINIDEDMFPMLMKFMQPLLSKEILYPSIKDLCDRYPKWLDDNQLTSDKEAFNKYARMFEIIKEVRVNLESQLDTDDEITKTRKFKELMELLKKMQDCGTPPNDLLRDIAESGPMPESFGQCNLM